MCCYTILRDRCCIGRTAARSLGRFPRQSDGNLFCALNSKTRCSKEPEMKTILGLFPQSGTCVVTKRGLTLCCVSGLELVLCPARMHGQTVSGITGTVADSSGAVLPDATVTVRNDATGVKTRATTTSAGTYTSTDLIPGTYTVKIEKSGFKSAVFKDVIVEAGGRKTTVDGVLSAGAVNETVEVNAQAITLETEQPELGATIERKALEELPAEIGGGVGDRGRQIDTFLVLTPGIQGGSFSHRINGGGGFWDESVFKRIRPLATENKKLQFNIQPPHCDVYHF